MSGATSIKRRRAIQAIGLALTGGAGHLTALADTAWPKARSIDFIVPFAAGGPADVVARSIAEAIGPSLGQNVVVDNRTGAAGTIGVLQAKRAKADGYTLLQGTVSTHAINATYYPKLPYDPVKDFDPVALISSLPSALLVSQGLPVNSVAELVAYIKANPQTVSFASSGEGTSIHLLGLLFAEKIGVKIPHVAYKGSSAANVDVAAGHVTFMFDPLVSAKPLIEGKRLKALALASPVRSSAAPDLPTFAQAGMNGMDLMSWQAMFVPAGTPREVVLRLNTEVNRALGTPQLRQRLEQFGMEIKVGPPEALRDLMRNEIPRWGQLVKQAGIQAT
ncbi:MAG: tripartite tricarboxylate transporter substrate binding protein [Proteobacteria bacterium]|nr:tripartite tricarboxylate transporter substrate binding protein [Pseudomonadota bacterium]